MFEAYVKQLPAHDVRRESSALFIYTKVVIYRVEVL